MTFILALSSSNFEEKEEEEKKEEDCVVSLPPSSALSRKQTSEAVRDELQITGTLVKKNDNEPTTDGDQSRIDDEDLQRIYLDMFRTGGDINVYFQCTQSRRCQFALSELSAHCINGRYRRVQRILERNSVKHGKTFEDMGKLLETRETAMRLTPLLLVFAKLRSLSRAESGSFEFSKTGSEMLLLANQSTDSTTTDQKCDSRKGVELFEQNLLRVISLLLQYGARPNAKDVTGRTVCFYGASQWASEASMTATTMCIAAAASAHCFAKEVVLRDMDDIAYDGKRGIAGGYQTDTGQRIVYVFGQKAPVSAFNRNIRIFDTRTKVAIPPPTVPYNLCNVQDRIGRVCLREIFDSTRVDVAKMLLFKHEASLDIADWNGESLRSLALRRGCLLANGVAPLIVAEVMAQARNRYKKKDNMCAKCGALASAEKPLCVCQPCRSVKFCSKECQTNHWKSGHRQECPALRKLYKEYVRVQHPSNCEDMKDDAMTTFSSGEIPKTSFQKPSHVPVDEPFTVKIQKVNGRGSVHVYDRTRECEFCIDMDQACYAKVLSKITSEEATAGTKAYIAASFNKIGHCKLYINRTKIKSW